MPVPPAVAAGAERLDAFCPSISIEHDVSFRQKPPEPGAEILGSGEVQTLVFGVRVHDIRRDDAQAHLVLGRLQEDLAVRLGEAYVGIASERREHAAVVHVMCEHERERAVDPPLGAPGIEIGASVGVPAPIDVMVEVEGRIVHGKWRGA